MLRHYPEFDGELHEMGRVIQYPSKRLTLPSVEGTLLVALCEVRGSNSRDPWTTNVLWELCLRIHLNDKRYLPGEAIFWEGNWKRFIGAVCEGVRNLEQIASTRENFDFIRRIRATHRSSGCRWARSDEVDCAEWHAHDLDKLPRHHRETVSQ